jgi:hypothetical protein
MPTYTGNNIKDLVVSTPTEGATPPSEVNDAIREIKTIYKNQNAVASKTANYTLTNADSVIYVSAASGNVILTLPQQSGVSSSGFIKEYIILRTDTSGNTVTINPYSGETIGGASSVTVVIGSTRHIIGNGGTDWKVNTYTSALPVTLTQGLFSVQVFTSSGTWTKPSGIFKARVQLVGGGGGGSSANYVGGGGAAGGYSEEIIDVSAVSTVTVTIGSGGAGAAIGVTPGGNGGTTSFGSYLSATGGGGGYYLNGGIGGVGGEGSGGDINGQGGDGGKAPVEANYQIAGGQGGASYFGGGGQGGIYGAFLSGNPGRAYGSGGGGSSYNYAGGAGKAGIVIVWEHK